MHARFEGIFARCSDAPRDSHDWLAGFCGSLLTKFVQEQIEQVIGLDCSEAIPCSGKTGVGVPDILEQIVAKVPPPKGDPGAPLRALVFDTWYDAYRGAMIGHIREQFIVPVGARMEMDADAGTLRMLEPVFQG